MDERNFTYMFYGFAAAWGVVCLYVASLALREKRTQSQMESLKRMLEEKEKR